MVIALFFAMILNVCPTVAQCAPMDLSGALLSKTLGVERTVRKKCGVGHVVSSMRMFNVVVIVVDSTMMSDGLNVMLARHCFAVGACPTIPVKTNAGNVMKPCNPAKMCIRMKTAKNRFCEDV